ncbi:MAG: hypothetical protein HYY16_14485 [Planctomycetes bacterium]|nr:hypothetical protein [Planctomycetota bacterium]
MSNRPQSKCRKCKTVFDGRGGLCLQCLANAPTLLEASVRPSVRAPARSHRKRPEEGPVCPYCRAELSWESMQSSEVEVTIYVREKMYFCPSCRALLGFSSWHTEG